MRALTKRIVATLLAAVFAICLVACFKADPALLNEKVTEMIDLDVAHDAKGGYAMLYPGVTDQETFCSTADKIYEYFPVTAGYSWKLGQWHYTKGLSNGSEVYEGQYEVSFDGRVFLIYAVWQSDEGGSGFIKFQIVSQEDWLAAQSK